MDKLNQLLVATPSEFAAAFDAVADDLRAEPSQTTAAFWLEGGITCAGEGFVWGNGELSYQGRNHGFRLLGLSIADAGAASICGNASVTHLRRLSDFGGSYSASSANPAGDANDPVSYLENEQGVVLKLTATDAAWRVHLRVNGLRLKLKRPK
jgi:hypothetical protein